MPLCPGRVSSRLIPRAPPLPPFQNLRFVGMMQYDGDLHLPANFLVPPPE